MFWKALQLRPNERKKKPKQNLTKHPGNHCSEKSWPQPVRCVMWPYKLQTPTHPKHTDYPALSTQFTHHILPQPVGWRRPSIMFASPELDSILLQDRVQWNQRQLSLHIFHSTFSSEGRYLPYWASCTHSCPMAIWPTALPWKKPALHSQRRRQHSQLLPLLTPLLPANISHWPGCNPW